MSGPMLNIFIQIMWAYIYYKKTYIIISLYVSSFFLLYISVGDFMKDRENGYIYYDYHKKTEKEVKKYKNRTTPQATAWTYTQFILIRMPYIEVLLHSNPIHPTL